MAFQPITEVEALALTRRQLLARVEQTQAWLSRPPNSAAKRAAGPECSRVMFAHLKIDAMLDSTMALFQGPQRALGYMDERVDGSPPRPPTRIQLSRRRRMPYGCRNVARPGPYGNPFTAAEYGMEAVARFRDLLADPGRYSEVSYPGVDRIREELGGWDLACWCPVPDDYISPAAATHPLPVGLIAAVTGQQDQCHADVLLRVANGGAP